VAARLSEKTASAEVNSPKPWWHCTPRRSLKVQTLPSGEEVQLSARSGSMNSGLISPGFSRTRPLKICCRKALPGVAEFMCGSSTPTSEEASPTLSVVFWAMVGMADTAARRPVTSNFFIFRSFPSCARTLSQRAVRMVADR
jgi:hypothetical protein